MPKVSIRTPWHKSGGGCWSASLGERGCRVRVTQRSPGGEFVRITWIPGRGANWASLKTKSRTEALKRAEAFYRAVVNGENEASDRPLTLGELWELYQREASGYRQNTKRTQRQKKSAAERLIAGLGTTKRVEHLTLNDVDRYVQIRRNGAGWPDGRRTKPVRATAVRDDLCVLRAMILWATRERKPNGSWLLTENPLRGMRLPKEENPRRPVATYDRFVRVREAARELAGSAPQKRGRERWVRFELALVLAEGTGRRIGAIRGLRWSDIEFDPPAIRWRAGFDKRGRESVVPIPEHLAEEVRTFKVRLGVIGDGWLFPSRSRDEPWPRDIFGELLDRAEAQAKVGKLAGGRWHAYRRKWATERKDMPLVDVKAAGGWRDTQTLLTCYQQADEETMLRVMASPVKLMSRKTSKSA
ncbi:MAG: tyrosine-type recombinase/integrase [Gemmatimonadetes bacterium]|nr:tyrosine-type recombinase/integrase [Gemmatimonadota bacterium]